MNEKFKNPEKNDQPADPEKRNTLIKLGISALVAAIGTSVTDCETGLSRGPEGCDAAAEGCEGCNTTYRRMRHAHHAEGCYGGHEGCSHDYRRRYRRYPSYRRNRRPRWNARLEKPEGCGVMWCEGPEGC